MHLATLLGTTAVSSDTVWVMCIVIMLLNLGCFCFMYSFEIYTMLPWWGPIRQFDSEGHEDLRINQNLLHRHAQMMGDSKKSQKAEGNKASQILEKKRSYAIGAETWGHCQAPWDHGERVQHPQYGTVIVHHHFAETEYLRMHNGHWARDERYFQKATGKKGLPLHMAEAYDEYLPQRMV
eukprot:gnl/TRDRNA2_/TRDRNA2_37098_c0_seq1.p1 gnl/TRDRNA2_/TRDRNA2_37098_c0~~gnl/TRDRNA2_/TRDRNA2_37098_c0_seq1.p1  ORF type:complete len:180 (+),score=20.06 gnl/TRDRNA2_/TRDRNA2_37098_c0_seq1:138-677(+)